MFSTRLQKVEAEAGNPNQGIVGGDGVSAHKEKSDRDQVKAPEEGSTEECS